jgi:hypothetical protein
MPWTRTILGVPGSTVVNAFPNSYVGNLQIKGPSPWIDAKAYGAIGDGVADDTAAINNAIAAAIPSKGVVFLPPGQYLVSELNFTGAQGVILRGAGVNVTRINPSSTSNSIIDWSGSQYCGIEDLQIGFSTQTPVPKTAILSLATTGGTGLAVTANWMKNVYVSGKYSVATLYGYGAGDGIVIHSQFYNYSNTASGAVIKFSNTNTGAMTSSFQTAAAGTQAVSDWAFFGTELHDIAVGTGHSVINGLVLEGTSQMRWYGGVLAGSNSIVVLKAGASSTLISGPSMYSDNGTQPTYHVYVADTTLVRGLTIQECNLTNPTGAVLATASGGSIRDLSILTGLQNVSSSVIFSEGGSVASWLTNALVNCSGLNVTGGTNTIASSVTLMNPGTITGTNNALMVAGLGNSLQFSGTVGNSAGTATMGKTLKTGTKNGTDYPTSSATFVDIDATNLALTVTIPTGWKLDIDATIPWSHSVASSAATFVLLDGATVVAGGGGFNPAVAGGWTVTPIKHTIPGDNLSHTVKLQMSTNAATLSVKNQTTWVAGGAATGFAEMIFTLLPSN